MPYTSESMAFSSTRVMQDLHFQGGAPWKGSGIRAEVWSLTTEILAIQFQPYQEEHITVEPPLSRENMESRGM